RNDARLRRHSRRSRRDCGRGHSRSSPAPEEWRSVRHSTKCLLWPERARRQRWRQSPREAIADRREASVAKPRTAGRAAAESGLTTFFSFIHGLLALQPGLRARRQPQNADEAGGILLVVTAAHGGG